MDFTKVCPIQTISRKANHNICATPYINQQLSVHPAESDQSTEESVRSLHTYLTGQDWFAFTGHTTLLFLYCFGRNLMASLCRDWFWGNYRTTNYLYCIHTHFHRHSLFNVDDGFQIDLKPVFEDSQSWLFSVFECSQFWLFSVLTSNLEIFFQI